MTYFLMKKRWYHHMMLTGGDCWSGKADKLKKNACRDPYLKEKTNLLKKVTIVFLHILCIQISTNGQWTHFKFNMFVPVVSELMPKMWHWPLN